MDKEYCPYCMNPITHGEPCPSCGLTEGAYAPSPHHLPPGTVLAGRYLIGRVLGEGGFGITYIGCDLRLELRVAIKEYYPHDRVNRNSMASLTVTGYTGNVGKGFDEGRERFIQEARVMARMDKTPQIVAVRDFFQENNTAYIVMEYVDGTTFKELVAQKGGKIPASELLPLVEPLFSALGTMHALGLIHRDISPDNLMLENGGVRLLDFGCARESAQGVNTMTIVLKHGYSPIEQYQHKGQGPWTDVYSLSATLYYCLTGKTPPQALDRICGEELTPPRQLGADLTPAQEKAILRGMGMRRSQRFPSVEELHAALYKGVDADAEKLEDEAPDQPLPEAAEGPIREETAQQAERAPVTAPDDGPEPVSEPVPEPEPAPERPPAPEAGPDAAEQAERPPIPARPKARWPVAAGAGAALVLLLALLIWRPWAGPSAADDPAPTQTAGPSDTEVSAQPTQAPSTDSLVNHLAEFKKAAEWLRQDDMEVGEAELRAKLDALSIDGLFADAVHVTTLAELDAALDKGEWGRPIVIDADIDFSMAGDRNRNNRVPVLISEGVTVSGAWNNYDRYENVPSDINSCWTVDGGILINRGTMKGAVIMGDWDNDSVKETNFLLNYGTIYSDLGGGDDGTGRYASSNVVVNLGTLGIPGTQFRQASLYNLGTILHGTVAPEGETPLMTTELGGDYYIDLIGCYFYNSGEILMESVSSEKRSRLDMADGTRFVNAGSIRLGSYGEVNNCAALFNYGEITATERTGAVNNMGWLCNAGPDCALDTAHCYNTGLIQAGPETTVDLSNIQENGGGAVLPFGWFEGMEQQHGTYYVSTKEEFYAALDDRNCAWIMLGDGVSLTLTEDLILTKGLAIPGVSSLTMDGCSLTVAGENGYLVADGPIDLRGGVLTVRDEAVAEVSGELRDCGGITIRNNGYLMLRAPLRPNDGAAIDIRDARYLCCIGPLELHGAQVNLERGLLRGTGGVELYGCTVDVGEGGNFLTDGCGVYFDPDTVITNHGYVVLNGWDPNQLACRFTNYGELSTHDLTVFSGSFVNYGRLGIWDGPESLIRVSGSLENHGTVEFYRGGGRFQPWAAGTVTGVPEQYVAG